MEGVMKDINNNIENNDIENFDLQIQQFMELAYASIEDEKLYITAVNNIFFLLKYYKHELKKRKLIYMYNKFIANLLKNSFQIDFQTKAYELVNQSIRLFNYLGENVNILLDSSDNEEIINYLKIFENFLRIDSNFAKFIETNRSYGRYVLTDYMLESNNQYLDSINESKDIISKKLTKNGDN